MRKVSKEQVEDLIALTPTQEGMLLSFLKNMQTREYAVQAMVELHGVIDEAAFVRAWQELATRHQALRSSFRWDGLSQPVQLVVKQHAPAVQIVHAQSPGSSAEDLFAAVVDRDRAQNHDLTCVPFRVVLVQSGHGHASMLLSYHHMIIDGWSLGILAAEFFHTYAALVRGANPMLPPALPLSTYGRWLQRRDAGAAEAHWRSAFAGYEVTRLPLVHRLNATSESEGHEVARVLDATLRARLEAFATDRGVTLASVLYAAFAIILAKYCGRDDVAFGTTVSGRDPEVDGVEHLVGSFVNTPPLRVRLSGTVSELCARVAKSLQERQPFETTPLAAIRRAIGLQEDPFDVIMVVENYPLDLVADGLRIGQLRSSEVTPYDLTVAVTLHEDISVQWAYRHGRLSEADVRRLSERYVAVLERFLLQPDASVADLDLFLAGEREDILCRLAVGPALAQSPPPSFLHGVLAAARANPTHTALACNGDVLTYGMLEVRAAELARRLLAHGVERGEPVTVALDRSLHMVIAILAIAWAGAVYVPVGPRMPRERLRTVLGDTQTRTVLVDAMTKDWVAGVLHSSCILLDVTTSDSVATPDRPLELPGAKELAYVIYTSGSAGHPKGVMVEHGALMNTLAWSLTMFGFGAHTRSLAMFDVTADTSLEDILCTLMAGGLVHIAPRTLLFDRDAFCSYVEKNAITFLSYLPSALRELLPSDVRLATVEHLVVGSEPLAESFKNTLVGLGYNLFNCYGTTEAAIDSLTQRCGARPVTLGRPNAGTACLILDRTGSLCPIGVPGELVLLGPGLARGYWHRDDLTHQVFVAAPLSGAERMYRTGDLALWQHDGEVRYLGRIDQQLKLNGLRIEPHEIELALLQHPLVQEAVVAVQPVDGQHAFLSAFVVCNTTTALETKNLSSKGLRLHLTDRLPEQMIPQRFIAVPELPRLPNGKVDLRTLRESLVYVPAAEYVAPIDDTERAIASVWASVLGRPEVTTATSFRELGGDSLMLIRVYAQLNKRFPGVLKVQDLFDHTTIQELAAVVRERTGPRASGGPRILPF